MRSATGKFFVLPALMFAASLFVRELRLSSASTIHEVQVKPPRTFAPSNPSFSSDENAVKGIRHSRVTDKLPKNRPGTAGDDSSFKSIPAARLTRGLQRRDSSKKFAEGSGRLVPVEIPQKIGSLPLRKHRGLRLPQLSHHPLVKNRRQVVSELEKTNEPAAVPPPNPDIDSPLRITDENDGHPFLREKLSKAEAETGPEVVEDGAEGNGGRAIIAQTTASVEINEVSRETKPRFYGNKKESREESNERKSNYYFAHEVVDAPTRNYQAREEQSKDGRTRGFYTWLRPDGRMQTVHYSAAEDTGFVAQVASESQEIFESNDLDDDNDDDDDHGKETRGYGGGEAQGTRDNSAEDPWITKYQTKPHPPHQYHGGTRDDVAEQNDQELHQHLTIHPPRNHENGRSGEASGLREDYSRMKFYYPRKPGTITVPSISLHNEDQGGDNDLAMDNGAVVEEPATVPDLPQNGNDVGDAQPPTNFTATLPDFGEQNGAVTSTDSPPENEIQAKRKRQFSLRRPVLAAEPKSDAPKSGSGKKLERHTSMPSTTTSTTTDATEISEKQAEQQRSKADLVSELPESALSGLVHDVQLIHGAADIIRNFLQEARKVEGFQSAADEEQTEVATGTSENGGTTADAGTNEDDELRALLASIAEVNNQFFELSSPNIEFFPGLEQAIISASPDFGPGGTSSSTSSASFPLPSRRRRNLVTRQQGRPNRRRRLAATVEASRQPSQSPVPLAAPVKSGNEVKSRSDAKQHLPSGRPSSATVFNGARRRRRPQQQR